MISHRKSLWSSTFGLCVLILLLCGCAQIAPELQAGFALNEDLDQSPVATITSEPTPPVEIASAQPSSESTASDSSCDYSELIFSYPSENDASFVGSIGDSLGLDIHYNRLCPDPDNWIELAKLEEIETERVLDTQLDVNRSFSYTSGVSDPQFRINLASNDQELLQTYIDNTAMCLSAFQIEDSFFYEGVESTPSNILVEALRRLPGDILPGDIFDLVESELKQALEEGLDIDDVTLEYVLAKQGIDVRDIIDQAAKEASAIFETKYSSEFDALVESYDCQDIGGREFFGRQYVMLFNEPGIWFLRKPDPSKSIIIEFELTTDSSESENWLIEALVDPLIKNGENHEYRSRCSGSVTFHVCVDGPPSAVDASAWLTNTNKSGKHTVTGNSFHCPNYDPRYSIQLSHPGSNSYNGLVVGNGPEAHDSYYELQYYGTVWNQTLHGESCN